MQEVTMIEITNKIPNINSKQIPIKVPIRRMCTWKQLTNVYFETVNSCVI